VPFVRRRWTSACETVKRGIKRAPALGPGSAEPLVLDAGLKDRANPATDTLYGEGRREGREAERHGEWEEW
jgi:hypothetical protein